MHHTQYGGLQDVNPSRRANANINTDGSTDSNDITHVLSTYQESYAANVNVTDNAIRAGSRIVLPVVPVVIKVKSWSKSASIYVLLDNGSTSSFCSRQVAYELGLHGRKKLCR